MAHWKNKSVNSLIETCDGNLFDEFFSLDSSFIVSAEENLDDRVNLHVHLWNEVLWVKIIMIWRVSKIKISIKLHKKKFVPEILAENFILDNFTRFFLTSCFQIVKMIFDNRGKKENRNPWKY